MILRTRRCLIEEIIIVDGDAPQPGARLPHLQVQLYHLTQYELTCGAERGRADFATLRELTKNGLSQPVWSGGLERSGGHTGCANLRRWARQQQTAEIERGKQEVGVGSTYFAGGQAGVALLPEEDCLLYTSPSPRDS